MIIKPKTDVVFKIMFTRKENENLLKNFISDVLDIPYDDITNIVVENSEITPNEIDGKFTRFDIKLTVDDRLINVEVQVNNYNDFAERCLYYWAQRYGSQLKKGEGYDKIQPTISINIVDFKMFDTEDYNSVYTMADLKHNAILTDKCAIHFFELPKLDKSIDTNNRKKLWMQLINSESEGDLEMLKSVEVPAIKDGVDVIFKLSDDKEVRDMAERREDAIKTEKSALYHAGIAGEARGIVKSRAEGEAIGIVKGRAEGEAIGIEKMVAGMRAAGLTEEQIEAIRKTAR